MVRDFRLRHSGLAGRLEQAMRDRFSRMQMRTDFRTRLERAVQARLAQAAGRFTTASRTLHAVSPLATIDRGFAVVTRPDGSLVSDADAVAVGEEITARLAHGKLKARVTGKED